MSGAARDFCFMKSPCRFLALKGTGWMFQTMRSSMPRKKSRIVFNLATPILCLLQTNTSTWSIHLTRCTISIIMIWIRHCARWSELARKTNICVLSRIVLKKRRLIFFIGKLPAKLSVHQKSGNGGSSKRVTPAIIH